jgi:hypothetical protein
MEAIIPTPLNSTPARLAFEGGVDQFDSVSVSFMGVLT